MNEILVKIDRAEKKVTEFKKLAQQIYTEANADNVIDAKEKKEIAFVAKQLKAVQTLIQSLKDEFERNKKQWENRGGDYQALKDRLERLEDWGKPNIDLIAREAGIIAAAAQDQRWLDAIDQLDTSTDAVEPLYTEYEKQAPAKDPYFQQNEALEARISIVAGSEFQSEVVITGAAQIGSRMADAAASAENYKFVRACELLEICSSELTLVEDEITTLTALKVQIDALTKAMQQRLADTRVCIYGSLTPMQNDIAKQEALVTKSIEIFDYATALSLLQTLEANLTAFEKDFAKIEADKALYDQRLEGLRPELLDASTGTLLELGPIQQRIAQIRARMNAAVTLDNFEQALVEMDDLVIALDDYKAALALAIARNAYKALLAQLEPQIYAAAVSNYGPLEALSLEIAAGHEAAQKQAASEDYEGALASLTALEPKLNRYFTELPRIEQDKAFYDGQLPAITERFNALARCAYPQMDAVNEKIDTLFSDMTEAASTGDYPNAVNALTLLDTAMREAELTLEELNYTRDLYNDGIAALLERIDTTLKCEYLALVAPFAAIRKDREAMEKAAALSDFPLAVDLMGNLVIQLDAADVLIDAQERLRIQYETAFSAIAADLQIIADCSYPELASKKTVILALRDSFVEQAKQTKFAEAYDNIEKSLDLVDDFIAQNAVCDDYIRRRDLAKERVDKLDEITYKTLEKQKKKIKDSFPKIQEEAMKGEVISALEKLATLEKDLKSIEDSNQQLVGLERAYKTAVEGVESDVKVAADNTIEDEDVEAKADAVAKAFEKMKKLGDEHKFEEGIAQGATVKEKIADYFAALKAIDEVGKRYEALKKRTRGNIDTAKTRAKDFPEHLDTEYEALESAWKDMNDNAEDDYDAAIIKLESLDSDVAEFNKAWGKLNDAKNAYKSAADRAIARFKAFDKKEALAKAKTAYEKADKARKSMLENAEDEDFAAATSDLAEFETAMDDVDDGLKTEGEHNAEYEGRYAPLKAAVEKLEDSPFADDLTAETTAAETALEAMEEAAGRRDYISALELAGAVDKALAAHNKKEDELEQEGVAQKASYDELMRGFKKRYDKASTAEAQLLSVMLAVRIKALPTAYGAVLTLASGGNYAKAYTLGSALRDEVDTILEQLAAEELALAKRRAEKAEEKDIWDFIEDKGLQIIKTTGKRLMDKAMDKVGGKIDAIWDVGNHLYSLGGNIKDLDFRGMLDDSIGILRDGAELHPVVMAWQGAVEVAEKGLEVFDLAESVYDYVVD